ATTSGTSRSPRPSACRSPAAVSGSLHELLQRSWRARVRFELTGTLGGSRRPMSGSAALHGSRGAGLSVTPIEPRSTWIRVYCAYGCRTGGRVQLGPGVRAGDDVSQVDD